MEILPYVIAAVWIIVAIFTMKKQYKMWGKTEDFFPYFNTFFLWFIILPVLIIEEKRNNKKDEGISNEQSKSIH